MDTNLIDRFLAACGASGPIPLRITCPGWTEPIVRKFHQPFVLLGRDPANDLCLHAPAVHPAHAYFQVLGGSVFAVDLFSETGTHWPSSSAPHGWLAPDHPIQIGPFTVQVANEELTEEETFGPPRDWNPILSRSAQTSRIPMITLELLNTSDRQPPRRLNRLLAIVGSAAGCNVRLVSSTVSPVHCSLLRTPMGLWAVDLLGRDGIRVNGQAVRYAFVAHGDELHVGKFRLRVGIEKLGPSVNGSEYFTQPAHLRPAPSAPAGEGPGRPDVLPTTPDMQRANGSSDFTASSLADLMLMRREDTQLMPLIQQFHLMQQQMFDQFQQAMLMVVQMFTSMHREQAELVRKDLDRVHQLTLDLQALQAELRTVQGRKSSKPVPKPEGRQKENPLPPRATAPLPTEEGKPPADAPDERIHAWLSDRIAAMQRDRQTQWQKIVRFLGGK